MVIRKATLNDSAFIATYLLLAMEDIVYKFIGSNDYIAAREFMCYFAERENNQYSYQNCWIAEIEDKVVAAVNLYDGAQLCALRQPVIEYIRRLHNRELEPEDETQAGEYYIDSLGVDPGHRGKGIGSKMLAFLIDEYVYKRGQTLGLLVAEENPGARKLYLKLGFESAGRRVIFGKNMEHLQVKR